MTRSTVMSLPLQLVFPAVTYTLAYFVAALVTKKKSFKTLTRGRFSRFVLQLPAKETDPDIVEDEPATSHGLPRSRSARNQGKLKSINTIVELGL
jgi:hypothetical protein